MSYPLLQFVASPDTGATVRFDFNTGTTGVDGSTEVLQDGFSLGSPTLEGDPDGIGSEYGFRELSIPLRINGTTTSAPAKFATLARELGRQTNWLRFQATATSTPYWFKTYRSAPEPLDWEQFRNLPDATVAKWYVDLKLDADSHAVGARVTIGPVTINNDPAAGTNPCSYALPAIVGDAPAPLSLSVVPSASLGGNTLAFGLATATESGVWGSWESPQFKQFGTGDGGADSTGTTTVVSGAAWSGGSARTINFDSVATTLANRYQFALTAASGRYKMLVRVAASDASTTFGIQGQTWDRPFGVEKIYGGGTAAAWLDLGEVTMPFGQPADVSFSEQLSPVTSIVLLLARRISGAGKLTVDSLALVPVSLPKGSETRFLTASFASGNGPATNNVLYVNADYEAVSLLSGSPMGSHTYYDTDRSLAGDFPRVLPGRAQSLVLFQSAGQPTGSGDDISRTAAVTMYYFPRYLYLGA